MSSDGRQLLEFDATNSISIPFLEHFLAYLVINLCQTETLVRALKQWPFKIFCSCLVKTAILTNDTKQI